MFPDFSGVIISRTFLIFVLSAVLSPPLHAQQPTPKPTNSGFTPLFDGKTLTGWRGDAPYWSVRDGAIYGEITEDTKIKANHFLIYEGEIPGDFEFVAEYRVSPRGNSGINYRSEVVDGLDFHALRGYQCDIDGQNRYTGSNYEERRRTTLASIGQSVVIPNSAGAGDWKFAVGNRWTAGEVESELPKAKELTSKLAPDQWHEVRIKAHGNVLEHFIDSELMSKVVDNDEENRRTSGRLGVQVHVGPPMTIEYRNLRVRALK